MQQQPPSTRKKFVLWALGIAGSLAAMKFLNTAPAKPKKEKYTVKMLSQDGTLVEVDASRISCGKRKKINDDQLKNWVTKK